MGTDFSSLVDAIKRDIKNDLTILKDVEFWIPTGCPSLDIKLGGGWPVGRLSTAIGKKSAGKSSLIAKAIAETQRIGGVGVWLDVEKSAWEKRSIAMGVDPSRLIFAQPESLDTFELILPDGTKEKRLGAFDLLESITWVTRKHSPAMPVTIVIDSIAGASVASEMEGDTGDATMGKHARIVSQGLRKVMGFVHEFNICLIFVNQLKQKIGVMYGSPDTYIAQNPIDFHSAITMQITQHECWPDAKKKETAEGIVSKINITKNKVADPFKEAYTRVFFDRGVDTLYETIETLIEYGKLEWGGGFITFDGKKRRKKEFYEMASVDPAIKESLFKEVDQLIRNETGKKGNTYFSEGATKRPVRAPVAA